MCVKVRVWACLSYRQRIYTYSWVRRVCPPFSIEHQPLHLNILPRDLLTAGWRDANETNHKQSWCQSPDWTQEQSEISSVFKSLSSSPWPLKARLYGIRSQHDPLHFKEIERLCCPISCKMGGASSYMSTLLLCHTPGQVPNHTIPMTCSNPCPSSGVVAW